MKKITHVLVALVAIFVCQTAVAETTLNEVTFNFSTQSALRSDLGISGLTWGDNTLPDTVTNVNDGNIYFLPISSTTLQVQQYGSRKSYALHVVYGGSFALEAVSGKSIQEIVFDGVTSYLTMTADCGEYDGTTYKWTGDAQKVTFTAGDNAYGKISKITVYYTEDAEPTSINDITVTTSNDPNTYNLYGQKVDENYKGIVIKGGKKYLNR